MKIKIITLILFLFVFDSLGFAKMLKRTKIAMGTFVSISLDARYKREFRTAFEIVKRVDTSLSSYKKESPIYRLNAVKKAKLDSYSYAALRLAEEYYQRTDGYFNVAVGSVTKDLYKFGEEEQIPSNAALHKSNVDLSTLVFDKTYATLGKNVKIDLGGMGKGFCLDRVSEYFKKRGIQNVKIAASGDIRCLGKCNIEVFNPLDKEPLARFETKYDDMGISTSGSYNRYVQTQRHNHLINPKTKESQRSFISMTLVSKLPSSDLDAYATAASVMPYEKALKFLDSLNVGYIILDRQKKLLFSKNIDMFILRQ